MKHRRTAFLYLMVAALPPLAGSQSIKPMSDGQATVQVLVYDPARDAAKDIENAVAVAGKTGQRILLDVGGNWCSWCRTMDKFFEEDRALLEVKRTSLW